MARKARKVSLINMKGGVGKSTLAVNLAWHFAAYGHRKRRVLLIDLDPQFNASQYLLGVRAYETILSSERPTVWDIFEQGTHMPGRVVKLQDSRDVIHKYRNFVGGGCIHLIPSQLELAFSLKNPGRKEKYLAKVVAEVESDYDLILIDCAPTESMLTIAAYLASNWLLVPVKPEYLSTIGLPLLVNSMNEFKEEFEGHQLKLAGVVFNAASDYLPEEALAKSTVRKIARKNKWKVFENEVEFSRSYPKGAREGQPIFRTSYSRWSKVHNLEQFVAEFAKRIRL